MTTPFHASAAIKLGSLSHQPGAFACILARPPVEPTIDAAIRPGEIAAIVTHDPGYSWPDRAGQELAGVILEQGGVVVLAFASLADASQCRARIQREAAR